MAPESSVPLVGLLSHRVLQALRAAGFLGLDGVLGPVSNRMLLVCVCGALWKQDFFKREG